MTAKFDFLAPDVQGFASAVSPGGTDVTVCTIPLASAAFALSAGRVCVVEFEFVGVDSNGAALYQGARAVVKGAATPTVTVVDDMGSEGGSGIGYAASIVSGDLALIWANNNTGGSGITQDVSVRAKVRWFGNA